MCSSKRNAKGKEGQFSKIKLKFRLYLKIFCNYITKRNGWENMKSSLKMKRDIMSI